MASDGGRAGPTRPGNRRAPARFATLQALVLAALTAAFGPARAAVAQEFGPPVDGPAGSAVAEAGLLVRQLGAARRVLLIGAHPDDEDTALLAELDRRRGVRTAYLSLTRGEGGQNVIGPELGRGLGLIRTGELLAARALDGAEQYFTRAYDFGYSKTAEETFRHWPRKEVLRDVVWRVRRFRPHVIVSIFDGTPADGHGHHQAAGLLAREAFGAAADSTRFPDQLDSGVDTWAPRKLYRRAWRDHDNATLRVPTGTYDPVLGRSPFQLAMDGRSQHRSQGFGAVQPPGPRYTRLVLLDDRTASAAGAPLFAGIDTTLTGLIVSLPGDARDAVRAEAEALREATTAAADSLRVLDASAAVAPLSRALRAAREAERLADSAGAHRTRDVFGRQADLARRALLAAAGLSVRLRAEDDRWVPGRSVRVHAELWNGHGSPVRATPPRLRLPEGWTARLLPADSVEPTPSEGTRFYGSEPALGAGPAPAEVPPGRLARWTFRVGPPSDARPTEQYFLRRDTVGDLYRWPDDPEVRGEPYSPPLAEGRLSLLLTTGRSGDTVEATPRREVRYRGVEEARGEFWRPVHLAPRLSVSAEPQVLISPSGGNSSGGGGTRRESVTVTVRSHVEDTVRAALSLRLPEGWDAQPGRSTVALPGRGATRTRTFTLREAGRAAAGGPGAGGSDGPVEDAWRTYRVEAAARAEPSDGGRGGRAGGEASPSNGPWTRGLTMIDYPHVEPVPLYRDADLRVERFPVEVDRDRRVGYVMGTGDRVPAAVRQLGLSVTMIDGERLRSGSLALFDVIVLGVRAYEVREDLQAANPRLLDWVREGGTLVVQYNKYEFVEGGYPPYRATMARPHDRVTDEGAGVTLLHPDSPALSSPNDISTRDFRGWVQERGLYFLHEWGETFTPLLATSDPGEEPNRGGLLVAPLGDGLYVYTGLSFFRQLPAGVPGAYRLFANLLSLEPAEWRAWRSGPSSPADPADPGGRP